MKYLVLYLLLLASGAQAQFEISGRVLDATTNKPLSFASIAGANSFVMANSEGNFTLTSPYSIDTLIVSYVGFRSQKIIPTAQRNLTVKLTPLLENLEEVAITKNEARTIIKKVLAAKQTNDPKQKLNFFRFKSYNKLIITAHPDSINGNLDSIFELKRGVRKFIKLDSTDYIFKKIISKQHIYQTEKISTFEYNGTHFKETVEAIKMAGFKKPIYELIALKLQSFSVYDNKYELLENTYKSPIGVTAFKDFNFSLLDTSTILNRPVYIIYFSSKSPKAAADLHGILYIDTENYAVAKAFLQVKNVINISANHEYTYFPEQKLWFPTGKSFTIVKGNNNENIKILGGQIQFRGIEEATTGLKTSEKVTSDFVQLTSKSSYYEHEFNVPLHISNTKSAIQITEDAIAKDDIFWQKNRKDSLDFRGQETYKSLDSLVISRGIERKLIIGRRILDGYLPFSVIDFDLRYLLKYNNYEGFRLGIGGVTNEKLSSWFKLDGYLAYGLKDEALKYKYGGTIQLLKKSSTWIGGSYTNDLRELASTTYAVDKRIFKLYDPRPINVSTFYQFKQIRGFFETKIVPKTESILELSQTDVIPTFNYTFNYNNTLYNQFTLTTFLLSVQWNPFSDYMSTPTGRLEIEKNYPKFTFQVTKSLPGVAGNDFEFTKLDVRMDFQKKHLNGQKTTVYAELGYGIGAIPLTHLYNTSPNNLNRDRLLQRITIGGKNSFETMYFNEFFSNRFAYLQIKHGFKRVTLFDKIKPSLVMVTRLGWGNMEHPERHQGINYKTLNEGYFESGIELNQIFKGLGLGGFYRYGPNQLSRMEDNIVIKLTFNFDLGF